MTFRANAFTILLFSASVLALTSACTPLGAAVGAGATVGVAAAQEGGIPQAVSDKQIQLYLNDTWFRHDAEMFRKLDMTVTEGRVLLTGIVQKPQQRVDAVRLAWQTPGVKQVINEIRVDQSKGIMGFASDSYIATKVRGKLTLEKDVLSINYNVDVVDGTVYLMGVAQDEIELNKVLYLARNTAGVKEVVSYVRMKAEQPVIAGQPQAMPAAQRQQQYAPVSAQREHGIGAAGSSRAPGYSTYPVENPSYAAPSSQSAQPVVDTSQQADYNALQSNWGHSGVAAEPLY